MDRQNKDMDILNLLRFVNDQNDMVIGTLVVLVLVTSIALLVRSINEKGSEESPGTSGASPVDIKAIEGAMRKVLASPGVAVNLGAMRAGSNLGSVPVAPSSGGDSSAAGEMVALDGEDSPELSILTQVVADRDHQISNLTRMIEDLKVKAEEASQGPAAGPTAELEKKISELQARLAEYEIIEDDIADLSLYKEENEGLKAEVASLREQLDYAKENVAKAPKVNPGPATELKFEKADKFELDPEDDVMKAFNDAVAGNAVVTEERRAKAEARALANADMPLDFKSGDGFELSPDDDVMKQFAEMTGKPVVKEEPPASEDGGAQSAIDAMFAAAENNLASESASSADESLQEKPEPPPVAEVSTPASDPQAAIDAMFAAAQAQTTSDSPKEEVEANPIESLAEEVNADASLAEELASSESTSPSTEALTDSAPSESVGESQSLDPQAQVDALLAGLSGDDSKLHLEQLGDAVTTDNLQESVDALLDQAEKELEEEAALQQSASSVDGNPGSETPVEDDSMAQREAELESILDKINGTEDSLEDLQSVVDSALKDSSNVIEESGVKKLSTSAEEDLQEGGGFEAADENKKDEMSLMGSMDELTSSESQENTEDDSLSESLQEKVEQNEVVSGVGEELVAQSNDDLEKIGDELETNPVVEVASGDGPLAGSLDPEKLMTEVAQLGEEPVQDSKSVLSESLDTDRLLEEIVSFGVEPSEIANDVNHLEAVSQMIQPPAGQAGKKPVGKEKDKLANEESAPTSLPQSAADSDRTKKVFMPPLEDDLFAEFKDDSEEV